METPGANLKAMRNMPRLARKCAVAHWRSDLTVRDVFEAEYSQIVFSEQLCFLL
jgi:hypothetical protein